MFNIASIYPFTEGCRFDFGYYMEKHMPLSIERLSKAEGFPGLSEVLHWKRQISHVRM